MKKNVLFHSAPLHTLLLGILLSFALNIKLGWIPARVQHTNFFKAGAYPNGASRVNPINGEAARIWLKILGITQHSSLFYQASKLQGQRNKFPGPDTWIPSWSGSRTSSWWPCAPSRRVPAATPPCCRPRLRGSNEPGQNRVETVYYELHIPTLLKDSVIYNYVHP